MIYSITLQPCGSTPKGGDDYYFRNLYKIARSKRTFEFSDGINVIIGSNGCGKTTLLNIIAGRMSIFSSSKINQGLPEYLYTKVEYKQYEDYLKSGVVCDTGYTLNSDIKYGNVLTYYLNEKCFDSRDALGQFIAFGKCDSPEQFSSMGDAISHVMSHRSDGESKIEKLMMFIDNYSSKSYYDEEHLKKSHWRGNKDFVNLYIDWIKRHDDGTKPTLLIDEIDRGMDIINQYIFWNKVIPDLAKEYQIIAITHNLALLSFVDYDVNFINFYKDKEKKIVDKILKKCGRNSLK